MQPLAFPASAIVSGTLADARLSSNVPLKNAANVFTAAQTINLNNQRFQLGSAGAGDWGLYLASTVGPADVACFVANGATGAIAMGGINASYFPVIYSGNAIAQAFDTAGLATFHNEVVIAENGTHSGGAVGEGNLSLVGTGASLNVYKRGVTNKASATAGDRWAFYANADGFHFFTGTTGDTNIIAPSGAWTFNYGVTVTGALAAASLNLGGATVTDILSATATLDFPSIAAGAEDSLAITVTGADPTGSPSVELGWGGVLPNGIIVKQALVSASNTVTVRVANVSAGAIDPPSLTCRATVTQF